MEGCFSRSHGAAASEGKGCGLVPASPGGAVAGTSESACGRSVPDQAAIAPSAWQRCAGDRTGASRVAVPVAVLPAMARFFRVLQWRGRIRHTPAIRCLSPSTYTGRRGETDRNGRPEGTDSFMERQPTPGSQPGMADHAPNRTGGGGGGPGAGAPGRRGPGRFSRSRPGPGAGFRGLVTALVPSTGRYRGSRNLAVVRDQPIRLRERRPAKQGHGRSGHRAAGRTDPSEEGPARPRRQPDRLSKGIVRDEKGAATDPAPPDRPPGPGLRPPSPPPDRPGGGGPPGGRSPASGRPPPPPPRPARTG